MTGPLLIRTLFLDAGGVLCHPSWTRVRDALADVGIDLSTAAIASADARAKQDIDQASVVRATDDAARGWLYFNKVLEHAGIPLSAATDAALAMLREYHRSENLWEYVPDEVPGALKEMREAGLTLVVVSNANGRLRHLFDRLGLTAHVDYVFDSHDWAVEKPDARLFQIALERSHSAAQSTAHVGDLYHIDVAGARNAGLREGVLLDPAGLYPQADCRRISTLHELIESVVVA